MHIVYILTVYLVTVDISSFASSILFDSSSKGCSTMYTTYSLREGYTIKKKRSAMSCAQDSLHQGVLFDDLGRCLSKSPCLFGGHFMMSLKLGMLLSLSLSSPDMHGCRRSRFTTVIPAMNTLCQNRYTELLYHVNINSIEWIVCLHFVHIPDLFKGICSTILLFKFGREPMSMNNDDSCL